MSYQKLPTDEKGFPVRLAGHNKALTLKYASLITLTVQNAALNITMRMARTQQDLFIASTAVIMAELIKIVSCVTMVRIDEGSTRRVVAALKTHIFDNPMDTLKVAVPSIVYYVQNNLIYVGATHLDAATAQVTYQLKILTTAIFSVTMLRKQLHVKQWFALLLLFVGVAMVQLVELNKKKPHNQAHEQSPVTGFLAVLAACCLSGFAGVYFEKILKGSAEVSLWIRNIQLASFAVPFGLIQVFITDRDVINDKGFFHGYTLLTWFVVLLQAQGGLLVAVVVKYADNILKVRFSWSHERNQLTMTRSQGFATSLSIILSCIVSVYFFHFELSLQFVVGAMLVISSIFLYSQPVPGAAGSADKSVLPQTLKN